MNEIETITWRELTGNKFVRGIDPAMLTEDGYIKRSAIRRIGERKRTVFDIVYDREYLVRSIGKTICRPLFILGKEKTLNLVSEAWDAYYQTSLDEFSEPVEINNGNYA
jgi:hypothetical protein